MKLSLPLHKKIYFASDFHLGVPNQSSSVERERKIVRWLDAIREDASALFLLGDIFDFWFEYKKVVPKGFVRLQGKLAELSDSGIEIYIFPGNHDLWMKDYFKIEFGAKIYHQPLDLTINDQPFLVGHGDGLGPGDRFYKLLKKVFTNPVSQWMFLMLPPVIGIGLAHRWSKGSRLSNIKKGEEFKGAEREYLYQYSREVEAQKPHRYYIFGHRHLLLDLPVGETARYINLGEWVNGSHYACFDGQELEIREFSN